MVKSSSLVFDLDGVLLDSESDLSWLMNALKKTLTKIGIPITDDTLSLIHSNNVHRLPDLASSLDLDLKELWNVRNNFYIEEKINALHSGIIKPFGDVPLLYKLQPFYELGILSNSPQLVVDHFINHFNFNDLFSYGVGRGNAYEEIRLMKPHSFMMTKLRKKTKKTQFIYVGDLETDKIFAENNKMQFIYLRRDNRKETSFSNLSDVVHFLLPEEKDCS